MGPNHGRFAVGLSSLLCAIGGLTEPEIWFRIVHITPELRDVRPEATDHDQTVEIALGPKGTFENGHVGTLTRRVLADRVVSAVPPRRTTPTRPKGPKTPRIVELLRKAIEWQALLESGEATSQAEVARREGLTRARVTQVMDLLRLAPEIQQHILSMPDMVGRPSITERALRRVTRLEQLGAQRQAFQQLVGRHSA